MKRKATSAADDRKRAELDQLYNKLRKDHPGAILRGEEYTMPWAVRRLPTGILDLDIALNGGIPAGGMTMLVGMPSVGKNWLANQIFKNQQDIYGDNCALAAIGTEISYDKSQANRCGVHVAMSKLEMDAADRQAVEKGLPPLTKAERQDAGKTVGDFFIVPPTTAEESYDVMVELAASRRFNAILLDSFGSILTEDSAGKGFDENDQVGGPANLNTKLMKKLNAAMAPDKNGRPNLTAIIGINQMRANIGARAFQSKTMEAGAWSLKHGRFVTIELTRTSWLQGEDSRDQRRVTRVKKKIGKTIKWEITKQKAGGWEGHTGSYDYIMEKVDIDRAGLALQLAVDVGIVKKTGNTYAYSGVNLGVGIGAASAMVEEHGLTEELEEAILQFYGVSYLT